MDGEHVLSDAQQFELERMQRVVDGAHDVEELRGLCKQLLQATAVQTSATRWALERLMEAERRPGAKQ